MAKNQENSHNTRGMMLADRGWLDESANEFKKAIAQDPECAQPYDNLATVLAEKGRYFEALQYYLKAIELEPDNATSRYNLGSFLFMHADKMATEQYQIAAELEYDCADVHFNLGLALAEQNLLDDALEEFQVAIKQDPSDSAARQEAANVLIEMGRFQEAITELRIVTREDKNNYEAWLDLGKCYVSKGFYDEADRAYAQAAALKSDEVQVYYQWAALRSLQKKSKEALLHLQTAIKLDAKSVSQWLIHDADFSYLKKLTGFKKIVQSFNSNI